MVSRKSTERSTGPQNPLQTDEKGRKKGVKIDSRLFFFNYNFGSFLRMSNDFKEKLTH